MTQIESTSIQEIQVAFMLQQQASRCHEPSS